MERKKRFGGPKRDKPSQEYTLIDQKNEAYAKSRICATPFMPRPPATPESITDMGMSDTTSCLLYDTRLEQELLGAALVDKDAAAALVNLPDEALIHTHVKLARDIIKSKSWHMTGVDQVGLGREMIRRGTTSIFGMGTQGEESVYWWLEQCMASQAYVVFAENWALELERMYILRQVRAKLQKAIDLFNAHPEVGLPEIMDLSMGVVQLGHAYAGGSPSSVDKEGKV